MPWTRFNRPSTKRVYKGKRLFGHWYRDNQVYFITARTRDGAHLFKEADARAIFWDRFEHYAALHGFVPWVTTLLSNHYHTLGYLKRGRELGPMMRKLHGSVAKLVNDTLEARAVPFWHDKRRRDYFDGCIRDEVQCRRAYRYTLTQAVRHGVCKEWKNYPDTHVRIALDVGVRHALEIGAFQQGVPYRRHQERRRKSGPSH